MSYCGPDLGIFTGMTQPQLLAALQQFQAAYVKLVSGGQLASASYTQGDGGKNVSFRATDLPTLEMNIKQLQRMLGMTRGPIRRPVHYTFR